MDPAAVYFTLFVASAILLGFVMLVLWLRLALETRLIVLGIAVGVAGVWYGSLMGIVTTRTQNRPDVALQITGDAAHGFMKLAAFLVLGGIAAALLGPARVTETPTEGARNVP